MCARKFENKHGVAIAVNKKWKHKINWTNNISERAIATSVTVKTLRITLMSVNMPHSGYADHHVEKAKNMIEKVIKPTRHMLIIGGDFNAELGPGIGTERRSVGQQTLNEANKRGDRMKQWLMTQIPCVHFLPMSRVWMMFPPFPKGGVDPESTTNVTSNERSQKPQNSD